MANKPSDFTDVISKVVKDFEKDLKPHDNYVMKLDRWYRAYRGITEVRSKAAEWTSKLHPAYGFQVIETLIASVVDPTFRWKVRGRPRIDDPMAIERLMLGIRANELLLSEQVDDDKFAAKQVLFAKQAFICQASVYKTFWQFSERDVKQQQIVYDDSTGFKVPKLGVGKVRRPVYDNPSAEVVDMRDFIPQEGSISLEKCRRVTHRVWYTYDELVQLEAQGVYGEKANGQPVSLLKDSRDFSQGASNRENDLFSEDRTKDRIEVLEQWRKHPDGTMSVTSIGNRKILLRNTPSPFWHGEFPFVVCSPVPDLGRIAGVSLIELIAEIQEAAWSFLNQRIDNTELLNNQIWLIASDFEGDFDVGPGAQNIVDRPDQIVGLAPNPIAAEVSIKAEEMLKADLQNIPGASPTLLGQSDPNSNTATEVSVTTTLAQKRISIIKQQFKWAEQQVGNHWLKLNQQFISDPRLIQVTGHGGAVAFEEIRPLMLQGDYYIAMEAMDESLIRQEQRAEAQSKFQVAVQAAQYFAALPNQPNLNLKAFMDDYLDSFDISDHDRYYTPKQQQGAPPPGGPQQGQQQGQPGIPVPGQTTGVTAPQSVDANSPSNAFSQSPVAALQRMGASTGGPNNI